MSIILRKFAACALACLLAVTAAAFARAEPGEPLVFAAASLKTALDDINAQWQKDSGQRASVSYAASSALAKQIEAGAPADLFISADLDWMDYLEKRGLLKAGTRSNLLGNQLVLIAPGASTVSATIAPGFPLASLLGDGRLAIASPDSVPAGKYGKASLQALGVWAAVEDRLAPADSVRSALALVSRGETPLGIVYTTDARADPAVRIVDAFPADTHPPIIYPVAIVAASSNPQAPALLAYLRSPQAEAIFLQQGFAIAK